MENNTILRKDSLTSTNIFNPNKNNNNNFIQTLKKRIACYDNSNTEQPVSAFSYMKIENLLIKK